MSEPLLTARQVAEQLGVSAGALLRWARAGKVPSVKLPSGAVQFPGQRPSLGGWTSAEIGGADSPEECQPPMTAAPRGKAISAVK